MLSKHSLTSKSNQLALFWLAFVTLCLGLLLKQWVFSAASPIETDILKLLPVNQQSVLAEQAFEKVTASMSDKVVFIVTAPNEADRLKSVTALESELKQSGYFKDVVGKIDDTQQSAWASYYFQHRAQLLTSEQRNQLSQHPEQQVQTVVQALYNPFSGVTGQELRHDPFLLFRDYLEQLSQLSSHFRLQDGYLTREYQGQKYVLITAQLNDSPYSFKAQQVVPDIAQWQQRIKQQFSADIYHTGVLFYADFGTQSAKSEISTIGLFSLLGIVLLVMLVFRSAMPLLLALLSVSVGLVIAMVITTAFFGQIHLFSLVFGASLIGVSIDYAFHYLTDRLAANEQWDSVQGLKHILTAITLGLITSLIGYLGLLVAPFPGLQQLALFSALGLVAAYATVVAWYPILAKKPSPSRTLPGITYWSLWFALWQKPWVKWGLPTALLIISSLALTQVHYNDDIRQLQAMPSDLKQQELQISALTGIQSSQQMLVVSANDDEALMQQLEKLDTQFSQWQQQGVLSGYQSLSQNICSLKRQQENYALVEALYANQGAALAHTLKLSSAPKLEASFLPMTLAHYLAHDVSQPLRFLYLGEVEQKVAAVVLLKEVHQAAVIKQFAAQNSDYAYLNKTEEISTLFGQYRLKVMELIALALTLISALTIWRYGVKHSIRIMLPSLIACIAGLAVTVATGSTLNLFNLLALVLVIGIGIDYTLFFAEQARSHSTLLAITLSALTTLLSFGLLALSQTHAIHSFGLTVLSGIFVAWLLSPMAIKSQPAAMKAHEEKL
ncbi:MULTISPECIES: MMPL family transporter [unclassified Vibrio]|uniref:MMPL family transporter n=1 Tax=unclassified Vibrio TaxID=2614977 RepID=UPI00148204CF|nr:MULTISPECIES: MMPL family transporter [unclassified Vibrio]MDQ2193971.1 MMPL family transporter [Vibrio sp. A14(2019)]MDQ2197820.1 MMPL family transporter [Vibrio sp. 2017_1457_11]NNN76102.1 MMPL family transporter [Vibrio sp. B7]NNN93719.1 MMPL family transporter [Vibrio sp. B8-1]NNO08080.1 MMPL family transporter [Vibrio sp. B4-12]